MKLYFLAIYIYQVEINLLTGFEQYTKVHEDELKKTFKNL